MRQRIQEVYSPNVIIKRPVNAGESEALGTEIAYSQRLTKWWTVDAGTNLYWFKIDGEVSGESLYQESFTYNARIANNFTILKEYKVQFVGKYSSREVMVQGFNSAVYSFDIAIKRDFFEKKLSASFQMRNLFNTEVRESTVETASLYSYRLATPKWPVFSVSLSLRLNNFKNQDKIETGKGEEF
jgi:outer membrane receptor protein involved in Fe transport